MSAHAAFFDRLVELVPAKYYLAAEQEPVNLKYLKKSARDEAKAAFKQQYKANKRAKLDPDTAQTTLQLQRAAAAGRAAAAEGGAAESDSDAEAGGSSGDEGGGRPPARRAGAAGGGGGGARPGPSAVHLALPSGGCCVGMLSGLQRPSAWAAQLGKRRAGLYCGAEAVQGCST